MLADGKVQDCKSGRSGYVEGDIKGYVGWLMIGSWQVR